MNPGKRAILCCLMWAGLSVRPASTAGSAARPYGGEIKISVTSGISTTNPARIETNDELELARQLHETLYRITPSGVVPVLAQEIPIISKNGKEWTIRLRPGLRFHGGSEITSNDIIKSFEKLLDKSRTSPHWWLLAPVKGAMAFHGGSSTKISGIERINKLSFRIRLQVAMPGFIECLAAVPTAPLPARVRSATSGSQHPSGSGPFQWNRVEDDTDSFLFETFLYHPRGRPYLDRVQVLYYPSARAAGLAFELDKLHLTHSRPSHRVGDYLEEYTPQVWEAFLSLNLKRAENMPDGYRRAIEKAIDRQSLVKYLFGNRGTPTDEIIAPAGDEGSAERLQADSQASREYFKRFTVGAGGIPPVFAFVVRKGSSIEKAVAERIQVNLVDVGAVVSVIELGVAEYEERIKQGEYDFAIARPLPLVRDPELQLLGVLARADAHFSQEYGLVQDYLKSLARLPMNKNRKALVREMARRYAVKLAWIPLFRHGRRICLHESVRGLSRDSTGQINLAEIWLAR